MQAAGATSALLFNAMPVKLPKWKKLVRKTHIKYEALSETSLRRYQVAVQRLFVWRSEFVNFLYLDERPLGWAGDTLVPAVPEAPGHHGSLLQELV